MTRDQLLLATFGGAVFALVAAAALLLSQGAAEREFGRRIEKLREGAVVTQPQARFMPAFMSLLRRVGNAMRGKMLSARDTETLAKSLAASGLEPAKAIPIFVSAKFACLFAIPGLTYAGAVLGGYSSGRQMLAAIFSLVPAMMLPNWVIALIRRPYQQALRSGIPDALDLMVVCTEAGLGLESAIERVAHEMRQSNRAVGVEFSLLNHEMRVFPDRRIALVNLAERTGQPGLKRFAGTVAQTLKYGTPLGQGLRTLAAEMRNERMIQFEERAGKLPALLILPMILFILPCLFIVMLGQPVTELLASLRSLAP
ncbi:MAG TPA: type II secretion system F family protein [Acetobacteraceae bacterium]